MDPCCHSTPYPATFKGIFSFWTNPFVCSQPSPQPWSLFHRLQAHPNAYKRPFAGEHHLVCALPVEGIYCSAVSCGNLSWHHPESTFSTSPKICFRGDPQPLNTTIASVLVVPQQEDTSHKNVSLWGEVALLTGYSFLTRVQAWPKAISSLQEYHHGIFPPVTSTQASANPSEGLCPALQDIPTSPAQGLLSLFHILPSLTPQFTSIVNAIVSNTGLLFLCVQLQNSCHYKKHEKWYKCLFLAFLGLLMINS